LVRGSNNFYDFSITVPGKIVRFDGDSTQAVMGTLTLRGEYGRLLVLRSIEPPKQWKILPQGTTDIVYTQIGDAYNARGPPLKAIHSSSLGNLTNFDLDPYWTGQGLSLLWSDPDNWDTGTVPTSSDNVTFDGTAHGVGGAVPNKNATIDSSFQGTIVSLTINGYTGTITQSRNLEITGAFSMSSAATFLCADPATYSFTVGGSFSVTSGTFSRFTGTGTVGDPFIVRDVFDLQMMNQNMYAYYQLAGDFNASSTSGWNSGAGFVPIGTSSSPFYGSLDGTANQYTITGLTINTTTLGYVGLFG
jgi:hypothetical protein